MKKGIILFVIAFFLTAIITGCIWYFNGQKEIATSNKELFIPNNAALVLSMNETHQQMSERNIAVMRQLEELLNKSITQLCDTLVQQQYINTHSQVIAYRIEGRSRLVSLTLLTINDIIGKNKLNEQIRRIYPLAKFSERLFDGFTITTLQMPQQQLFFAVCGGILLISDSQFYIEDGIKQFGESTNKEQIAKNYRNISKFFSPSAALNIYISETFFRTFLHQFIDLKKLLPQMELAELLRWGALDADIHSRGVSFNGFMNYDRGGKSYFQTFSNQMPSESSLIHHVPASAQQVKLINLSDINRYLVDLDHYRQTNRIQSTIKERQKLIGKSYNKELNETFVPLFKGEFAFVTLDFSPVNGEDEGILIASINSQSLCRTWLEEALTAYAESMKSNLRSFKGNIRLGSEYSYYKLPHCDLIPLLFGDYMDDVSCRIAMVNDDHLIIASSEKMLKQYIEHKRANSVLSTTGWFKTLKDQLAKNYNLAYFMRVKPTLEKQRFFAKNQWRDYLQKNEKKLMDFTVFASQWSNEEGMLYNNTFIMTDSIPQIKPIKRPLAAIVEASNSMKPIKVKNHLNGATELFVQDDSLFIYLMNRDNKILWKRKLSERINSDIYQIDAYKNGKLQLLFSTPSAIYLIDRNGKNVENYPIHLASKCLRGITMFDYDKTRDYRIFAPLANQKVMLYDEKGTLISGWNTPRADKEIMSAIEHFRIDGKDYIIFADKVRVYILNRKGDERVRVSKPIELRQPARLTLQTDNKKQKYILLQEGANRYHISLSKGTVVRQ